MASISRDKFGKRRILFIASNGKRKTIRLGKMSQRTAEALKVKVEALISAKLSSCALDDETSRWVANLGDELVNKLVAVGLIPQREKAIIAPFLEAYILSRTDTKPLTKKKYFTTQQSLIDFFGADKPLKEITEGDAEAWRLHLLQGRCENTVRKYIAVAKVFFSAAVKRRLISSNPFAGLKATIQANESRFYFITSKEAERVIAACPDAEWRLIFALSRYGGLRCPSEHLALRWGDIDWERSRMRVPSPKTEHHPGGESRIVPIYPELRPYLEEVWEQAKPGTEYVITRYRETNVNLRSRLLDIIWSAGLKEWPKLFQNLRSTRQTELSETFPSHVVCKWMGNSKPVADRHYLQTTEAHFAKAIAENQAAQKAAQQPAESTRKVSQPLSRNPNFSADCDPLRIYTSL
ncbi:MAG: tyrosine-type recombinase/integrase [Thermoguttaceae bacterium]|jgi:integrase